MKKDYNDVETKGGRAALKVELNDNWTILPQMMGQVQDTNGNFAFDPKIGDLQTCALLPGDGRTTPGSSPPSPSRARSATSISCIRAAISPAILMKQQTTPTTPCTTTSPYGSAAGNFVDNKGNLINPSQYIVGRDHYTKTNHEIRVKLTTTWPVRFTAGFFIQRQVHEILQNYTVPGAAPLPVGPTLCPSRVGREPTGSRSRSAWIATRREFTEASYDIIIDNLTLNAGIRYYTFDNTLQGFYGFNEYSTGTGVALCQTPFVSRSMAHPARGPGRPHNRLRQHPENQPAIQI